MRLYLMRHGKAVRDDEDRTRPLARRGERQAAAQGRRLRERDFQVARVLHSPKLRARQTAELFCQEAFPGKKLELADWMLPFDDVGPWVERVSEAKEDLLLIGHNPFMEHLTWQLVGENVRFKTSTLVAIECHPGGAHTLLWVEHPARD
jgi:phosphohistidine phosphatase